MRRRAAWLPLGFALVAVILSAALNERVPFWPIEGMWLVAMPFICVVYFGIPYLVPMLVLAGARRVRRRSAAPPFITWVALALALPALVLALWWPLDNAAMLAWHEYPSRGVALTLNRSAECAAVWTASVVAASLWVLVAARRWLWWARPVAVAGTPPYR